MRKLLISSMLLSTVAAAAPAAAQHGRGYGQGANIERELDQVERQIDTMRDRRLISRGEADRLERQAEQIDRLHDRYRRDGLTRWERNDLQNRVQALRQRLRAERQEGRWEDRRHRR